VTGLRKGFIGATRSLMMGGKVNDEASRSIKPFERSRFAADAFAC